MTASPPGGAIFVDCVVGIRPRAAQITGVKYSSELQMSRISKIRFGLGLRRTPRNLSPSAAMVQPLTAARRSAVVPVIDRADGLGGVAERGVVAVDFDLGQQGGEGRSRVQQVAEFLLDDVAGGRLGLGAEHVERIGRNAGVRRGLQRQQTDLGAIAVGDDTGLPGSRRRCARSRSGCWPAGSQRSSVDPGVTGRYRPGRSRYAWSRGARAKTAFGRSSA